MAVSEAEMLGAASFSRRAGIPSSPVPFDVLSSLSSRWTNAADTGLVKEYISAGRFDVAFIVLARERGSQILSRGRLMEEDIKQFAFGHKPIC